MSSFNAVIKKRNLVACFVLEIDHPTEKTVKVSTRSLESKEFGSYSPLVRKFGTITRSLDPTGVDFGMPNVSITLNNHGDTFGALFDRYDGFSELEARIYLIIEDVDGSQYRKNVYTGLTSPQSINLNEFKLELSAAIFSKLGNLQSVATSNSFPQIRKRDVGIGLNIPLGSPSEANSSVGLHYCPVVDVAQREIAVAQGSTHVLNSGKADPGTICRLRNGQWTTLQTYTLDDYGQKTDINGIKYRFAKIPASEFHLDDAFYVLPKSWAPPSDSSSSHINAIKAVKAMIIEYSSLTGADFSNSWDVAEAELAGRIWDESEFGYNIPETKGALQAQRNKKRGWGMIADVLQTVGYYLILDSGGLLSLTLFKPWEEQGTSAYHFDESNGDFSAAPDLALSDPKEAVNQILYTYAKYQQGDDSKGSQRSLVVKNVTKQASSSIKEIKMTSVGAWGSNIAAEQATEQLKLRSGSFQRLAFKVPGLWGTLADLGEQISVSHGSILAKWKKEKLLVSSISINPGEMTTSIKAWRIDANPGEISIADAADYLVSFNGSNQMLYSEAIDTVSSGSVTIRCQIRFPQSTPAGSNLILFTFVDEVGLKNSIFLETYVSPLTRVQFNVVDSLGRVKYIRSSSSLSTGQYYEFVFSYDAATNAMQLYLNGVLNNGISYTANGFSTRQPVPTKAMLGGRFGTLLGDSSTPCQLSFFEYESAYHANGTIVPEHSWSFYGKSRIDDVGEAALTDYNIDDTNFVLE